MKNKSAGEKALETFADGLDAACDGRGFGKRHEAARTQIVSAVNARAKTAARLYLVVADDGNGENADYFVNAKSPRSAVNLWRKYLPDMHGDIAQVRVFPVPTPRDAIGVIEWPEAKKIVV